MAYRKLEDGDLVRIVTGEWKGYNAVVIDVDAGVVDGPRNKVRNIARVQIGENGKTVCTYVFHDKLLIRHEPWTHRAIVDGRVDHDLAAKYQRKDIAQAIAELYDDEPACGECSCCKYHEKRF